MKNELPGSVLLVALLFSLPAPITAQAFDNGVTVEPLAFLPTPLPGHHIDAFRVNSSIGIRTLTAILQFDPMAQVQPGGQMTVFPDLLASGDLLKDTHFLFDTSSATINSQYEDKGTLSASVTFNANFPTSFMLAQAVVTDVHSAYDARVFGTLVDGREFATGTRFVPEPSVSVLGFAGVALWLGWRFTRRQVGR